MRAGSVLQLQELDFNGSQPLDWLSPSWTRIDHVPFGATVDIDHVLLSEAGVVVFTSMTDDEELAHALTEARWRARKIMALVGRVAWVPALPVLVASGLAELEVTGGYALIDGVLVVREVDAPQWIAHLEALPPTIDLECIGEMVDTIVAHIQRTDAIISTYPR
jgi:hypothetical protein